MRKLDLTTYQARYYDGEARKRVLRDYELVDSLCTVLLHPLRHLTGPQLMKAWKVAEKIRAAEKDPFVLPRGGV